jgi:quercetin dioxygenase-like cupin family protein
MVSQAFSRSSLTPAPRNDSRYSRSNLQLASVFCAGCLCGIFLSNGSAGFISYAFPTPQLENPDRTRHPARGSVVHLHDLPMRPTSHKDEQGRPVLKQQLMEPFVVPRVTGFSVATFQPNQQVFRHAHANMHEFFYVLKGQGAIIQVNDDDHVVQEGTFVHVAPGEQHAVFTNTVDDLQLLVVGVVTDDTTAPPPQTVASSGPGSAT